MISFRRMFHVSSVAYNMKKQGLKLCKMVNPVGNKQSWYPAQGLDATLPTLKGLTKTKNEPGKRGLRRSAMLNKMFMKQITDLMSTGTVAMDIVGRGIEISKVSVSPDFKTINVYWVCKGKSSDATTEAVLNRTAGALRHELSTLRVMGEVPYIVFVKDKQEALVADLDRRLAEADYGEDYVLTEEGHLLKSEFVLNTKLSPEVMAKIKQLEEEVPTTEEPIPEMTHNVFGLDHAKIMNRLLAARKKSRDAWTNLDTENEVISYRAHATKSAEPVVYNQSKELAEFLLQRQILHKKIAKQAKNSSEDWQLSGTEEPDFPFPNPDAFYYGEEMEDDEEFNEECDYDDYDALEAFEKEMAEKKEAPEEGIKKD